MSAICVRVDAKTGDSSRIPSVVQYITDPVNTKPGERLICRGSGNLFADTSAGIAAEMRGTADAAKGLDSRVSVDPLEHFVISFEAGDAVAEEDFKRAIDVALKHLKMEDHQFTWGAHNDTGNIHIHLAVLRVNPNSLKAVSVPFVVKQSEQIGALINHELGMKPMMNNRYRVDDDGNIEKVASSKVKEPNKLAEIIKESNSWEEFHRRTREIGINFDKKGSGALINGEKASDVDRNASMAKLVKKWGLFVAAVDAIERPYVLPVHVERAVDRQVARKSLSAQHRNERTEIYQLFKQKKNEIWQTPGAPGTAKIALSSFIAGDEAKALASLKDKQKIERQRLRDELNRNAPLLKKVEIENTIHGECICLENPATDIRAYKAFVDHNSKSVIYSVNENTSADFIDHGKSVSILNLTDDSILAALQLSQVKFGAGLTLNGGNDFKMKALKIAVANGISISNPELQKQYLQEKQRLEKERLSVMATKYESQEMFKALADAVPADRWRVTLGGYVQVKGSDGKAFTPTIVLRDDRAEALTSNGSGRGHDGLSVVQVCERWGYLEHCQDDLKRARVILTPASDTLHIIHIDDVSDAMLEQLKAEGFEPCAIIQTSQCKHNILLTTPKDSTLSEKENHDIAKTLSQLLNKTYGDPEARNAMQPFRAPGFRNMKPKYRAADGSYPAITLKHAVRGDCAKLAQVLQEVKTELASVKAATPVVASKAAIVDHGHVAHGQETEAYFAHVKAIRRDSDNGKLTVRRRKDGTLDQSSIDVLAAQRMRMTGWHHGQIVQAVANGCNEVRAAHGDTEKRGVPEYAQNTASIAAKVDLSTMAHQVKYRLFDEKQSGIISPSVAANELIKSQLIAQSAEKVKLFRDDNKSLNL